MKPKLPSNHSAPGPQKRLWVIPVVITTIVFIGGVVSNLVANYVQPALENYRTWVWTAFAVALVVTIIAAIREWGMTNGANAASIITSTPRHSLREATELSGQELSGTNRTPISVARDAIGATAANALHQLPPPPHDFTGREAEIAELMTALESGGVAISGLRGQGGAGKTTLALKLSQMLKPRYPDAQFYLDLKGVSSQPLTSAEAMAHIIRAYYPATELPENEMELSGLYRSVLEGKRALLLMDNAKDRAQVEPLIPPAGCVLLVTSRQHFALPGLFAKGLDTMPPTEARELLMRIAPRVGEQADELARLCGYLPLALRLAASTLAERPNIKPVDYVQRLTNEQKRLELVEASLNLSYGLLSEERQRQWRALAVFPERFDEEAAAAVWEAEPVKTQDCLGEVLAFSLVEWNEGVERYRLHDLGRVFADSRMSEEEREAGGRRHAVHYQKVLAAAEKIYLQGHDAVARGLALFDRERANIEAGQEWAVAKTATDITAARLCIEYSDGGVDILYLRQYPHERIRWVESMLVAARGLKRRDAEGRALGNIGVAFADLGEIERAIKFYEESLNITREVGDRKSEGATLSGLSVVHRFLGETRRSIEFSEQALAIAREVGNPIGEGMALDDLGIAHAYLGEYERAIEFYERRLMIAREIGDRRGEGRTLSNLGSVHASLGDPGRAIALHNESLAIAREIGDRRGEGWALGYLGKDYAALGETMSAIEFYEQRLAIAREIGSRRDENQVLGNLGRVYTTLGDIKRAVELHERRLAIARAIGDTRSEAIGLRDKALALDGLGDRKQAIELLEAALTIFEQINDPKVEKVRTMLAEWRAGSVSRS